jgi:hypothetical protein
MTAALAGLALFLALPSPLPVPAGQVPDDGECFTVLVGKKASADGSVLVAHNEDDRGDIIVNLRKIKARDYGAPQSAALGKGAFHETDGRTSGFLWIEATTQEFADSFINEHGVLITSDSCPSRVTAEDYADGGIGWMLRRLVAEKAKSAREAVRLAGELVEKYGYRASGRTYSIADKDEAWMLAALRGRHWIAQRVPDDEVAVIPNFFTIRGIRLDDPDHFLGSRDIVAYAKANGWYDEAKDGAFDFKRAFDRPSNREPAADGNALRQWRGVSLVSGKAWELGRRCADGRPPRPLRGDAVRRHGRLQDGHAQSDQVPDHLHRLDHQRLRRLPRRQAPRAALDLDLAGPRQARHHGLPAPLLRGREPAGGRRARDDDA